MSTRSRTKRAQPVTAEDGASRPTKRGRKQDIVEEEDDREDSQSDQEDEGNSGRQQPLRSSASGRDSAASDDDDDDDTEPRREFIEQTLPELSSQADKLIGLFSDPEEERQKPGRQHYFRLKRNYFHDLRQPFEDPEGFPFIDPDKLSFVEFDQGDLVKIGYANLATALDVIDQINSEEEASTLEHLKQLDDFMLKLFKPFSFGDNLDISLNIRSILFVKTLEEEYDASKNPLKMARVQQLLAACFCDPSALSGKVNYPHLFVNGPFRPLGHDEDEDGDPENVYGEKLSRIIEVWKKAEKGAGTTKLREEFPFDEILTDLRNHIFGVHDASKIGETSASQTQEQYHDAQEDVDELESVTESQPIVRASTQQHPSFFTGPESMKALKHGADSSSRQRAPSEDRNSAILGPRPTSVAPSTVAEMPHRQRVPLPSETPGNNEDDEDPFEEDSFEEDTRRVDKGKAAAVSRTLNSRPTSVMPPPPRPSTNQPSSSAHEPPPPSSAFDLIKSEKSHLSALARSSASDAHGQQPVRQRHQWSDHDQFLLIDLVARCHGSWTKISDESRRFDHPRNQQAYRDKARNLKVDFLMTDRVLPPSFDLVALGQKETNKLVSFGKNPYRKEKDLDDDGRPINTEFVRA